MSDIYTPSRVLEEYDIVGRRIPKKLVAEMREKFRGLEEDGEHVWKMLCDEVVPPEKRDKLEGVDRKIAEDRLWVVQGCAEVISPKWSETVQSIKSPNDYLSYFLLLGIPGNKWESSEWLSANGLSGLYVAIKRHFGSWTKFKEFMVVGWSAKVLRCHKPNDFINLFREEGILDDSWKKSKWLAQNGFKGLYLAIKIRYNSWGAFLVFMRANWKSKVANCHTPNDFINLFREEGILNDRWKSSSWLKRNGLEQLYRALRTHFESWNNFLRFMEVECIDWGERVSLCKQPQNFITLFRKAGILDDKWRSSEWMCRNNFNGLYDAIVNDNRFKGWKHFLTCMDGHLPFNGFESPEQAQQYLAEEILRLRGTKDWIQEKTESTHITREEWEEIAQPKWYKRNPVVKVVMDYLHSQEEQS